MFKVVDVIGKPVPSGICLQSLADPIGQKLVFNIVNSEGLYFFFFLIQVVEHFIYDQHDIECGK